MKILRSEGFGVYCVELTRRNLEVLLAKLDRPDSKRTLVVDNWFLVRAVENEAHYTDREPGPMHPDDEAKVKRYPIVGGYVVDGAE